MKCKYSNAPEQIAWRQVSISGSFWEKKKKRRIRQTSIRKGLSWTYPVPEQGDLTVHQSTAPALFSLLFYFCSQPSHRFRWLFNCGQPWISSSFPGADFRMRFSFPSKWKSSCRGSTATPCCLRPMGRVARGWRASLGTSWRDQGAGWAFPMILRLKTSSFCFLLKIFSENHLDAIQWR